MIDRYRRQGYCIVVTMDLSAGAPRPPATAPRSPTTSGWSASPTTSSRSARTAPTARTAAVQLRPLLQLLLARLRAAGPVRRRLPAATTACRATGRGRRRREARDRAVARWALARRCSPRCSARCRCGSGTSATACRSPTTPTRPSTSCRVRSAMCARRARPGLLREPAGAHLPAVRIFKCASPPASRSAAARSCATSRATPRRRS